MKGPIRPLFRDRLLREVFRKGAKNLGREIKWFKESYLLGVSTDELVDYLFQKYDYEAPELYPGRKYVADEGEAQIDVRNDWSRDIQDRSRSGYMSGQFIEVAVPFSGNSKLFKCQASTRSTNPPCGRVENKEVRLRYEGINLDPDELKRKIGSDIQNIEKYLEWTREDVNSFNNRLRYQAKQSVERRKDRLNKNSGVVEDLSIPVKRRDDAPKTYAAPVTRKKSPVQKPPATKKPSRREPELPAEEYEYILEIISSMADVLERSPDAFADMDEEDLRSHFLVQLNGQYEGSATGETFNGEGKTDILIRTEGKQVFIAECKFWKGPKAHREAIDQLLSYTSWRDTKTALILLNRNKDLSAVLEKIPEATRTHPNHKRKEKQKGETRFRHVLHQNGDESREVILTILVFNVPS